MTRKKVEVSQRLSNKVTIRLSQPFYNKMEKWLENSNCQTMAELARNIICREKIIWYHKDSKLESTALELSAIRKELNAIGNNINQITRYFHGTDIPNQKMFHALKVVDEYKKVESKVGQLLEMMETITKTWLQK